MNSLKKSRIIYLILIITAACLFVLNGEYVTFAALVIILLLPFFLYGATLITSFSVTVLFGKCSHAVQKSESAEVFIKLFNSSVFPISSAKIYIEIRNVFSSEKIREVIVVPLKQKENTMIKTAIQSKHCGDLEITVKRLVLYDFFSITRHAKRINKTFKISVLPTIYEILKMEKPSLAPDDESYSYSDSKSGDDPSQVFDYHEYREGDHMKNIHWKLSTKLDRLMVKEGSLPNSASVLIGFEFNTDGKKELNMEIIDGELDVLTSISTWLFSNGIPHFIEWYEENRQSNYNMKVESSEEMYTALEHIYKTTPHTKTPLLDEIADRTTKAASTQTLYITSIIEQSMIDSFAKIKEKTELVVCFVHDKSNPIGELLANELKQQEITLIDVQEILNTN